MNSHLRLENNMNYYGFIHEYQAECLHGLISYKSTLHLLKRKIVLLLSYFFVLYQNF